MLRSFLALIFCALSSCAFYNPPPLMIKVTSTDQLNHQGVHSSLPVAINLYQLENRDTFKSLSFIELAKTPGIVKRLKFKTVTVAPKEHKVIDWSLHPKAKYVAAVALFRKPHGEQLQDIKPIPSVLFREIYALKINLTNEKVEIR